MQVVLLSDIINEAVSLASESIASKRTSKVRDPAEVAEVSEILGVSAIIVQVCLGVSRCV